MDLRYASAAQVDGPLYPPVTVMTVRVARRASLFRACIISVLSCKSLSVV